LRQQSRVGARAVVQGPFQAGVANVKGNESHGFSQKGIGGDYARTGLLKLINVRPQ